MLGRFFILCALLAGVLYAAAIPRTARAASQDCSALPAAGPVGTTFALTAHGFTPNTPVWLYAVEPDGTAFSDSTFNDFGGASKSDANGRVSFSFRTRFELNQYVINRALGEWTLVAEEKGLANALLHQARCTIRITSGGEEILSGASLAVDPPAAAVGSNLSIHGSGFAPSEPVSLWLSPPPFCSGWAFSLPDVLYHYSAASGFSRDTVKAQADGSLEYSLPALAFFTCTGEWHISARGETSRRGAIAVYSVAGRTVPGGASLSVFPERGYTRGDTLSLNGQGFTPGATASCWLTRPEGTVKPLGDVGVNGDGSLTFSYTTGFDFEGDFNGDGTYERLHYSEGSIGTYHVTCRDNATGITGETAFILTGLAATP